MREPDFGALTERLLRGGVAPTHVRRMIAELRDHHTDLFGEAFAGGRSLEEASLEASIRLGDEEALAAEVLARPELRSWAHRWPRVAYGLTPTVLLAVAWAGLLLALGLSGAVGIDRDTFASRWGAPESSLSLVGAIRLYTLGLPALLGGVCCALAGRRRAALRWPVLGVLLVSIVGGASQLALCWPNGPSAAGALCLRLGVLPPFPDLSGTVLRAVTSCALTLGPYLWWRRRVGTATTALDG